MLQRGVLYGKEGDGNGSAREEEEAKTKKEMVGQCKIRPQEEWTVEGGNAHLS